MTDLTRKNRNQLMAMMAMCEDIARTNNRIHGLLEGIMDNPSNKHNLDKSIRDLLTKVDNLKSVDIGTKFQTEEIVVVPTAEDASPKKDIRPPVLRPKPVEEKAEEVIEELVTPEEEEHNEELEEAMNTPQPVLEDTPIPPRRPRRKKRVSKRPLRGLQKNKVEILDPDIQKD